MTVWHRSPIPLCMTATVAIVGRPNVGKSTLFNRLKRSRDAIVDDTPNVTRDRLYASIRWDDTTLTLIDTGGFDDSDREPLLAKVREQVQKAIDEADSIIFLVDGREGVMPGDEDISDLLRRSRKRLFLAVNKIDGPEHEPLAYEFFRLGLEKVYSLSAAHGYGLRDLMEEVAKGIPQTESEEEGEYPIRVAIVGRPNVGKSSLINRILGSERLLVSDVPGTTRDSVDTSFQRKDRQYLLIDTAGIRRKARVKEKIEKFSMIKAIRSLDRCDIAVVVLDAFEGVGDQDSRICSYASERERGIVLAVNKWDLVKGDRDAVKRLNVSIERQLKFISFAPMVNLSARTGERIQGLFEKIDLLYGQFSTRTATSAVNKAIEEMLERRPPPGAGQGRFKILYATQAGVRPPTFLVFVNRPEIVPTSYRRFMTNQMRESLGLSLTPIRLILKKK